MLLERSQSLRQPGPKRLSNNCPVFLRFKSLCLPLSGNSYLLSSSALSSLPALAMGHFAGVTWLTWLTW